MWPLTLLFTRNNCQRFQNPLQRSKVVMDFRRRGLIFPVHSSCFVMTRCSLSRCSCTMPLAKHRFCLLQKNKIIKLCVHYWKYINSWFTNMTQVSPDCGVCNNSNTGGWQSYFTWMTTGLKKSFQALVGKLQGRSVSSFQVGVFVRVGIVRVKMKDALTAVNDRMLVSVCYTVFMPAQTPS